MQPYPKDSKGPPKYPELSKEARTLKKKYEIDESPAGQARRVKMNKDVLLRTASEPEVSALLVKGLVVIPVRACNIQFPALGSASLPVGIIPDAGFEDIFSTFVGSEGPPGAPDMLLLEASACALLPRSEGSSSSVAYRSNKADIDPSSAVVLGEALLPFRIDSQAE